MLYHGLRWPSSLWSIVAVMKAVAVWPGGKELRVEPSGRMTLQLYLSELTAMAISAAEKASDVSMRPHELRLSTPQAFRPSISPAGAYCR